MAAETVLTNSDKTVLVIDKNELDYAKPCGGGVPNELLDEFPFVKECIHHKADEVVSRHGDTEQTFDVTISMTRRSELRKLMYDRLFLNVKDDTAFGFMMNSTVTNIDIGKKVLTLQNDVEIEYEFLIGADGVNSIVAKTIGFHINKALIIVIDVEVEDAFHKNNRCVLEFLDDIRGYFWVFPKGDHINIGLGGDMKGKDLRALFDKKIAEFTKDGWPFKEICRSAHLIPMEYNTEQLPLSPLDGIVLCGDAASFVNPMTGEGIYFALKSGKEAAELILSKRNITEYPSFGSYLERVQAMKDDMDKITVAESYDKIFCDETSKDTVDFLFSHYIPERKALTDDEKKEIYSNV